MAEEMEQENLKRPLADEREAEAEAKAPINESAKRARLDPELQPETTTAKAEPQPTYTHQRPNNGSAPEAVSRLGLKPTLPIMPPSLELVTGVKADLRARKGFVGQEEVGIIGYAGDPDFKGVKGVIKQRFTDFLVNEVGLDGEVLRLKHIGKPTDPYDTPRDKSKGKGKAEEAASVEESAPVEEAEDMKPAKTEAQSENQDDLPEALRFEPLPLWKADTTRALLPVFAESTIASLHALLVEGKDPPPKSDSGWGSRKAKVDAAAGSEEAMMNVEEAASSGAPVTNQAARGGSRGQGRDRGRGRGGRGGRGGGRGGESEQWWAGRGDDREVLSQPMTSKEERTKAHQTIRELFSGTFETAARDVAGEEGQRIAITWSRSGGQSRRVDKRKEESDKPRPPQYIHFTLHKTNRDTQDCITHLSRALGCQANDLSVCGTKDKRAVTVQRVCFKRRGKNLLAVWKGANNVRPGRNTEAQAVQERGDRGARIGDLEYSTKYLELGMLKGNHFAITLRSVQSEASREEIDAHLTTIRSRGFVNFYGMQRFGTSTVPTHVTGLFILQSKWAEAVDSILSLREGEHPDCVRGRLAWLEDEDIDKALELMPRRCVAERSIWQHWKKTGPKDKLGALGSIPRNLRTMYVHAYQSYIWNLVVSERIKLSATEPLVGDLVFDGDAEEEKIENEGGRTWKPSHETSSSQDVKRLTVDDLPKYTIHDVIMPLPGWNIDYPGGEIGELYGKILKADDLDAHKMRREQREYSLPGSYRKMIHLPSRFAWSHVSYTDPDVSLVQSDEDRIIGQNPPAEHDPEGKFQALKIELTLGPSAYATMAIREITREETSTWHHIGLTAKGEDQEFKGTSGAEASASGVSLDETAATEAQGGEEEQANANAG